MSVQYPASRFKKSGKLGENVVGSVGDSIGKAKQGLGKATGSDRLAAEGVAQEIKGGTQSVVGAAKGAAKAAVKAINRNL
jgi:uncharacterized protein YjbJ (UPF0337 family)